MAYDASNLATQLFSAPAGTWTHAVNSNANVVPTVANGKVYVASNRRLQIFGLLPPQAGANRAALPHALPPSRPDVVTCAPSTSPAAVFALSDTPHQFYGKVCRSSGSEIQLSLRSGHSIALDVIHALARHQRVRLTPGRTIRVTATIDQKGVAHAQRIFPAHTLSPLTPADR
jgi:hypothetical protein